MPEATCTLITPAPCLPPACTLLTEARVIQSHLAGLGESVMVGDADALDVEDLCADAAAMMGRLVEALADARKAASRLPPSSPRPPGMPPVPPPAPWQPSAPAPVSAPAPANPSRRGLLASAAGLLALGAVSPASAASSPAAHPDAELIALCAAHDDLERRYRASFEPDSPEYIEDDDERDRVNDSIREAQEPLAERICDARATTPEGMRARVHSILLWDGDADPFENPLCLGWATDRRMTAALFRDLLALAGEGA